VDTHQRIPDAAPTLYARLRRPIAYAGTVIFAVVVARTVPLARLAAALSAANYPLFLAVMVPNAVFYFFWDTWLLSVVMRWFHRPVPFRDLLPARGASYVAALFNTNLARATLAYYLKQRTGTGFLQLGSTVVFLVWTEFTHLVLWATIGVVAARGHVPIRLLAVAPIVMAAWLLFLLYVKRAAPGSPHTAAPRDWSIVRTFRIASLRRYPQIIGLRAPMFLMSLLAHYLGARAFGIHIPFVQVVTFLPVIFMAAALPLTVAHLGTTQAAWMFFFGRYAPAPQLLAFSLAAHLSFVVIRALISLLFVARAIHILMPRPAPDHTSGTAIKPRIGHDWALH
jgi:hypothetical protein